MEAANISTDDVVRRIWRAVVAIANRQVGSRRLSSDVRDHLLVNASSLEIAKH
jgi:hypothetical protein